MPPDMPGGEVAPGRPEHDDAPAGHVLAAVVADALDDQRGPGVAHREPLADPAAQEHLAGGGAVADDVAGDDLLVRRERRGPVGPDDHPAAGQPLADVVVGVALQAQRDPAPAGTRRTTARPSREGQVDRVVGQARAAVACGSPRRRAWCRRCGSRCGSAARARTGSPSARAGGAQLRSASLVQGPVQAVVLGDRRGAGRASADVGHVQDRRRGPAPRPSSGRSAARVSSSSTCPIASRACGSPARPGTRGPPRR